MLTGNINHLDLVPYLPKKLKEAIEYVKLNINANTPAGTYEIDGENIYVIITTEAKPREMKETLPEFHNKYIDVQIVLEGEEGMSFSNLPPETEIVEDKLAGSDIAFIKNASDEKLFILKANDFIVFYPKEVHKPLCIVNNNKNTIKKAVIKVAISCL